MTTIPSPTPLTTDSLTKPLKAKSRAKWVAQLAKSQVLKRLAGLRIGQLTLVDGAETHVFGQV
jgi:cyclopropane-fatty-acyl-phospholipid synthase